MCAPLFQSLFFMNLVHVTYDPQIFKVKTLKEGRASILDVSTSHLHMALILGFIASSTTIDESKANPP